jgi:hypothetical protein
MAFKWEVEEGVAALEERLDAVKRRRMTALNALYDACDEDEFDKSGDLLKKSLDDIPGLVLLVQEMC